MIVGPTHPDVLAEEGEAYRNALVEQVRRDGMADSVVFDARYFNGAMLTALIQSAAVVVLPYDSTEQVSSGALADAIAAGRPGGGHRFPARRRGPPQRSGRFRRPRRSRRIGDSAAEHPDAAAPGRFHGRRSQGIGARHGVARCGGCIPASGATAYRRAACCDLDRVRVGVVSPLKRQDARVENGAIADLDGPGDRRGRIPRRGSGE